MRVVHMTSVHRWDDNRVFNKMCRSLAQIGHEVHLVAVSKNNLDGKVIDGVKLHSIKPPKNRWKRFAKATPAIFSRALDISGDLYHFHDPEFLPYLILFRHKISKPFIYDIHEDYSAATFSKNWVPIIFRVILSRIVDILEKRLIRSVDGLIVAWPKIKERFLNHPKLVIINNYPYKDELFTYENNACKRQKGYFVYVGVLSKIRGILEIIRAVNLGEGKFKLFLAGNWSPKEFEYECRTEDGWKYCEYKGYLGREDIRQLFSRAQAGLIAFHPKPNHLYSVPNKMFEYMSAGLPVIASDLPMQRKIVKEIGCGLIADSMSHIAIYKMMQWIYEHPYKAREMGFNGRRAVESKFNWETEVMKLIRFYKTIK